MSTKDTAPCSSSPLEAHPEIRPLLAKSETFRRLAERARIDIEGVTHYLVRGDTLGTLDDLLVDTLARGSSPESSDAPSRALFLELPAHLQDAILRCVRRDPPHG
ncbi:Hypothetical protein A7982_05381 [Minicystis rosea]|nr:Hypothetical protein A7982_05381 [Minicystis rosea]